MSIVPVGSLMLVVKETGGCVRSECEGFSAFSVQRPQRISLSIVLLSRASRGEGVGGRSREVLFKKCITVRSVGASFS